MDYIRNEAEASKEITGIPDPPHDMENVSPSLGRIVIRFNKSMNTLSRVHLAVKIDQTPVSCTVKSAEWKSAILAGDTLVMNLSWSRLPENACVNWVLDRMSVTDIYGMHPPVNIYGMFKTGTLQSFNFRDNGNATVTDSNTSLTWMKCSAGLGGDNCEQGKAELKTFNDADDYCDELNSENGGIGFAGRTGWRLPVVDEIASLQDYGRINSSIDGSAFPNTQVAGYWTSTEDVDNPGYVIRGTFNYGYVYRKSKSGFDYVRCVSP